jgi:hypothetical protein
MADALGHGASGGRIRFREHQGEFIACVAGGGVHEAAGDLQGSGHPLQAMAADQVTMAVIDNRQGIHIE